MRNKSIFVRICNDEVYSGYIKVRHQYENEYYLETINFRG